MIIVDLLDQIMDLMGPTQKFKGRLDATRVLLDPTTHLHEPLLGLPKNIPERIVDLMEYMEPMEQMFHKMGFQPMGTFNAFHLLAT